MSKKILSVALALVLVMSTFALSAFAASKPAYEEDPSEYTQAWKLEDASEGDVYKANIYLKAEYGVGAVQFKIESAGKADLIAVDSDVFVGDYDINFSKEGLVFIVPTPAEGTESMDAIEFADETLIATLTFELAEGADSAKVSIENAPKNEENPDGTLVAARVDDGNLVTGTSIVGQEVTAVAGSATFGAAPADLALTAAGTAAGIVIDTNKTFAGAYDGVVYGFKQLANNTFKNANYLSTNLEVTNGGTWELNRTISTSGYSTGTTITIKNSDGSNADKVYVVVIFGDVNADGLINTADANAVYGAISDASNYPNNSIVRLAANCSARNKNFAHTINTADALEVYNHLSTKMDAAAIAAAHAGFNANYQ